MEAKTYHHGDLRHALIKRGIELVCQEGEENLSLRKAAAGCGVSNAAPYAHFKNKDEFIGAIQQHIMDLLAASLEETLQKYNGSCALLSMLGKAYVMFFYENPVYFDLLFSRKNVKIKLSLADRNEIENQPLDILKKAAVSEFQKTGMSEQMMQDKVIAMWALVQGLTVIATMPNVEYDDDWETRIEGIIKSVSVLDTPVHKEKK